MDAMLRAIEEYTNNFRMQLESFREKGVLSDIDIAEQMKLTKKKISQYLEADRPYGLLLMDLENLRARDKMEYVSLTEIAKKKNAANPSYVIQSWLRDRNTIEFLRLWEKDYNENFNDSKANELVKMISESSFTITAKIWIEETSAIGITSKRDNQGGTYAHRDIAIDLMVWLFPEKRYELVKIIGNRMIYDVGNKQKTYI